MRTIVVTHTYPWPAHGGGAIRAAYTIDALAELGPVDVACIVRPSRADELHGPDGPAVARLVGLARPDDRVRGWKRLPWLVAGRLPSMRSADYAGVRAKFAAWAGDYDLAWFGCGSEAFVAVGGALPPGVRVVANLDDLEDRKIASRLAAGPVPVGEPHRARGVPRAVADRVIANAEIRRWRSLHVRMAKAVDRLVVCSELDRRHLAEVGVVNADVVPNVYPSPATPAGCDTVGEPPTLTMIGTLHYPPNADAARFMVHRVFPEIRRRLPGTQLRLVGRGDADAADLARAPGVVAVGEVDDVDAELAMADVSVVPVRFGSGTRIKILEAFAHRIPVVSTTVGAEGLDVVHGRELMIADSPSEFAATCIDVLTNQTLRQRLISAGNRRWSDDHRVEVLRHRVRRIATELIDREGPRRLRA